MELEEQRYGRNKSTAINRSYIESGEYRRKFDGITKNKKLNRLLYQLAKKMLIHRSGTKIEDMYWIDANLIEVVAEEIDQNEESRVVYSQNTIKAISGKAGLITIHSHPESFPPSAEDFYSNFANNYSYGIVACHDGKVFVYGANVKITTKYVELVVSEYKNNHYSEYDSLIKAINKIEKQLEGNVFVREMV